MSNSTSAGHLLWVCMDASAYLRNQGWRGDGHSLDQTDRGIKKPLLVSKKVDVLGVGLNKHAKVSDQWWLRAFDQGLKRLGTGEETTLGSVQKHGMLRGGLYGRFIKGEDIPGSIGQSLLPTPEDSDGAATSQSIELLREQKTKVPKRKSKVVKRTRVKAARDEGTKTLAPGKLAKYRKRAKRRGMTVEDYFKRRENKKAKKQSPKLNACKQTDVTPRPNG